VLLVNLLVAVNFATFFKNKKNVKKVTKIKKPQQGTMLTIRFSNVISRNQKCFIIYVSVVGNIVTQV